MLRGSEFDLKPQISGPTDIAPRSALGELRISRAVLSRRITIGACSWILAMYNLIVYRSRVFEERIPTVLKLFVTVVSWY
jgi:hypothetical protein